MAELGALVASLVFVVIYYFILRGGEEAMNKGADATEKGVKKVVQKTSPVVAQTKEKIEQAKKSLFAPNAFLKVWEFMDFVRTYGPIFKLVTHTNTDTGEIFYTCEVTDKSGKTKSIRFSSQLGELSAKEIAQRKNQLYVGQTNNGKYYLYDKNFKAWEDVDLGINIGEE